MIKMLQDKLQQTIKRLPEFWLQKLCIALGAALFLALPFWFWLAVPAVVATPTDFSYTVTVPSYSGQYSPTIGQYVNTSYPDSTFSYKATKKVGDTLTIANTIIVQRKGEAPLHSSTQNFTINAFTGKLTDDSGYLLAPRHMGKQDFSYFYAAFRDPMKMRFQNEEQVLGLNTYRFQAQFQSDQTKAFAKSAPEMGTTKGIIEDVDFQAWFEPTTGRLVKFEDTAKGYLYDLATKQRLQPWMDIRNHYDFNSIVAQVRLADKERQQMMLIEIYIPVLIAAVAIGLFAYALIRIRVLRRRALPTIEVVSAWGIGLLASVCLAYWALAGVQFNLPASLTPMYPGTACSLLLLLILQLRLIKIRAHSGRRMMVYGLLLLMIVYYLLVALYSASGEKWGLPILNVPVIDGYIPIITTNVALYVALLSLAMLLKLLIPNPNKLILHFRELLVVGVGALCLAYILSYAYGDTSMLQKLSIRPSAAIILVLIALLFAYHEPQWYIVKLFKKLGRVMWLFAIVLLGLLAITGFVWQFFNTNVQQQSTLEFQSNTNKLQSTITDSLQSYTNALLSGSGLFMASTEVTRDEWNSFVDNLRISQSYPGVQGFGYAVIIPPGGLNAHIQKIRSEGFPNYTVHTQDPGQTPQSAIIYLEPFDARNQRAFGYDMMSEPVRYEAMARARDNNEPAMSGKVILLQETTTDVQAGFAIYVPIYKKGMPIATTADRQAALQGFVYSPFRMNNFMNEIIRDTSSGINVEVFDTSNPSLLNDNTRLFSSVTTTSPNILQDTRTLTMNGHTWTIRYTTSNDYVSGVTRSQPNSALVSGIILSFAVAAAITVLGTSRQRALLFARKATRELTIQRNAATQISRKDEAILEAVNDGLVVLDNNGHVARINAAALHLLGYEESELLGKHYVSLVTAFDKNSTPIPLTERPLTITITDKKSTSNAELYYKRKNGQMLPVQCSAAPIIVNREVVGAIEIFHDMTQEKELEKAKDDFLSLASHQLRTPLTAKKWYLEMLLEANLKGTMSQAQHLDILRKVQQSNDHMIDLVNNLLNVSRIESGRLRIKPAPTDLHALVDTVVGEMLPVFKNKKQKVVLDVDEKLPHISIDQNLIRQVFTNLLSNANTYSPAKTTITIRAQIKGDFITFDVTDQGYGIPQKYQAHIFEKFFRAENILTKAPSGNGLGLFLVKATIEASGGKISLKSRENHGTTFTFTLPLKGSEPKKGEVTLEQTGK